MARGVNKVILLGHLGQEPDVRYSATGLAFTNLSLATSFSTKDKQTGEWRESTEWHRVVLFERLAEVAGQYLRKGSQVYIEGRLQTRKWQDQNGVERYTTEIVANEMQLVGGRSDNLSTQQSSSTTPYAQPQNTGGGTYSAPPPATNNPPSTPPPSTSPQNSPARPLVDQGFDDDVPF